MYWDIPLQIANMDEAKALLERHPFLGENADFSIKVNETMRLPGCKNGI